MAERRKNATEIQKLSFEPQRKRSKQTKAAEEACLRFFRGTWEEGQTPETLFRVPAALLQAPDGGRRDEKAAKHRTDIFDASVYACLRMIEASAKRKKARAWWGEE